MLYGGWVCVCVVSYADVCVRLCACVCVGMLVGMLGGWVCG